MSITSAGTSRGAHDERVEQHSEGDDERDLHQERQGDHHQGRERRGEHHARRGDHPAGGGQPAHHPLPVAVPARDYFRPLARATEAARGRFSPGELDVVVRFLAEMNAELVLLRRGSD
jgi:hypothetical protein